MNPTEKFIVGNNLKLLRCIRGGRRKARMAAVLGLPLVDYLALENGERELDLQTALNLERAFPGIRITDLTQLGLFTEKMISG